MKFKFSLSLFISIFVCASFIYSQKTNYPIEKINGKEYYKYKVQSGEGLYAISKIFGVSQAEINNLNPQIHEGLKAGMDIMIPKEHDNLTERPKRVNTASQGGKYISHIVQPKETLFSVSRKYNVNRDEILKANPNILNFSLKIGEEIKIPVKQTAPTASLQSKATSPIDESDKIEYILHTVERKQTLYAISRKYDTTQEAIILANPNTRNRGIRNGDVLRIPVKKENLQTNSKTKKTDVKKENLQTDSKAKKTDVKKEKPAKQTFHVGEDGNFITHKVATKETLYSIGRKYHVSANEIKAANPGLSDVLAVGTILRIPFKSGQEVAINQAVITEKKPIVAQKTSYKIAYLLPFMLNNSTKDATIDKFIDFYMGSLLAINNAKNSDMNFEIQTYDIEKSETKVYEIINTPELQEVDLIIGPAYTTQIPVLTDFAKRHKIHTLVPFSSKVAHIESNPYVFQFNPDQETQIEFLANTIRTRFSKDNIIFVETGHANATDDGIDIFNVLTSRLNKLRIPFKKIKGSEMKNIETSLSASTNNIFIFDSDNYNQVQYHMNSLYDLSSTYNIAAIGQYSWRALSGKKPKMYYISPFMGNSSGTDFYETEYAKYYGKMRVPTNPRFDLLGYDLTSYFLSTMKKDGFTFDNSSQAVRYNNGVQSDLNFKRIGNNGGFVNQNLYLIKDEAKAK